MTKKIFWQPALQQLRTFPFTLTAIWLFTLFFTYLADNSSTLPERFLFMLFYYGSGSFLLEALLLKKQKTLRSYALFLLPAVPSIIWLYFQVAKDHPPYIDALQMRYTTCYFLLLFSLGVYFCFKGTGCSFPEYLVRVFGRTIRYCITYFVLMIGISLIVSILVILFDLDFIWLLRSYMLLFGLYFMSSFLLSFYPEKEESSRLTALLCKYILTILVLIAFVIIYAYILKILILWDIPSNALFRITAGLFLVLFPVCMMDSFYIGNSLLHRIIALLPYFFLPFLFLQGYSIGIRILENGITPLRYAAAAFLLFECLALLLYHFRRAQLSLLLPVAALLIFLCGFFPFLNMNRVSFQSQKNALQQYLSMTSEEQLLLLNAVTDEDAAQRKLRERFRGAYSYLRYDCLGNSYLESLQPAQTARLEALYTGTSAPEPSVIHYYTPGEGNPKIDVDGYRFCYPFSQWDESENLRSFLLLPEVLPDFTVDMDTLLRIYMEEADENEEIHLSDYHRLYPVGNRYSLYLTDLSFGYAKDTDTFTDFHIEGYLLEK